MTRLFLPFDPEDPERKAFIDMVNRFIRREIAFRRKQIRDFKKDWEEAIAETRNNRGATSTEDTEPARQAKDGPGNEGV